MKSPVFIRFDQVGRKVNLVKRKGDQGQAKSRPGSGELFFLTEEVKSRESQIKNGELLFKLAYPATMNPRLINSPPYSAQRLWSYS